VCACDAASRVAAAAATAAPTASEGARTNDEDDDDDDCGRLRIGSGIRLDSARSDCPRLAITKRIANLSEAALIRGSPLPPSTPSLEPCCTRCIRGRRSAVIAERAAARGAPTSRAEARESPARKILGKLAREDEPDMRKMRSAPFFFVNELRVGPSRSFLRILMDGKSSTASTRSKRSFGADDAADLFPFGRGRK